MGAAHLAEGSDLSLAELRKMVTSPGGTTEAALAYLDERGLMDVIQGSVKAAFDRSIELGKKY